MKTYILMAIIYGYGGGIVTQEFSSKSLCEVAGKSIITEFSFPLTLDTKYICVEK